MNQNKVTIDSLVNAVTFDKDVIGGELISVNDTIPIYNTKDKARYRGNALEKTILIIKKIRAQIDYNRIYDLTFDGDLVYDPAEVTEFSDINKIILQFQRLIAFPFPTMALFPVLIPNAPIPGKNQSAKSLKKLSVVISNREYSLGIRSLNDGQCVKQIEIATDSIDYKKAGKLYINFADVIKFSPYEGEYAEILQNGTYKIEPEKSVKVQKRTFSDYISFRTFLDPLGFLSNGSKIPNGFAQLEGDAIIPMRVNNNKQINWLPQFNINFSYIYANSINSDPRIAPVYSLTVLSPAGVNTTSRFVNNIDVIKYRYYYLNAHMSVLGIEFKKAKSFLHFEAGIQVAGARVGQNNDSNVIINKFIPDFRLRLELRPDYIIGGSLSGGIAYNGNSHRGNNSPFNPNDISYLYQSAWALPHEINLYAFTGKGRGGLFFRYLGWLAFNESLSDVINKDLIKIENNNITKTSYFPQILIGYSTNLSTLIKQSSK